MNKLLLAGMAAVAMVSAASSSQAANILTNAGFESGSLGPWVQTNDFSGHAYGDWAVTGADAHSGAFSATDIGNKLIEQSFAGVLGSSITEVSFWLRHPGYATAPTYVNFRYSDASEAGGIINTSSTDWQFFNVTGMLNASKTLVGFGIYGCNCGGDFASTTLLDDVMINAGGAGVPEPATWALMIGGFGLAGATLRRRRMVAA